MPPWRPNRGARRTRPATTDDSAAQMASSSSNDDHAAWSMVGDVVGDAAKQETARPGHALVTDHDQVGFGLFGDVEDRLGGLALDRMCLHLDPLLAGGRGGGVKNQIDVLARADLVLHIRRGAFLLAFDLPLRDRRVGAD